MDAFIDERDYKLLSGDKYTFSVLSRIIGSENELLLSDHEKIIVCFTCQPYPVWIWTPDDASEDETEDEASGLHREGGLQARDEDVLPADEILEDRVAFLLPVAGFLVHAGTTRGLY